jgi:hypothetical protein
MKALYIGNKKNIAKDRFMEIEKSSIFPEYWIMKGEIGYIVRNEFLTQNDLRKIKLNKLNAL